MEIEKIDPIELEFAVIPEMENESPDQNIISELYDMLQNAT